MNKIYNDWLNSKNVSNKDKEILKKYSKSEIDFAFGDVLTFGTAGVRREMGIGSSLINEYTVSMITLAFVRAMEKHEPKNLERGIIVGHDCRIDADKFSQLAAEIISGMGYKAIMFYDNAIIPTPLISFTIKDKNLGGGLCITASHNPPKYNGYKVMGGLGQHLMPISTNRIRRELNDININTLIPKSKDNIITLDKHYEDYYISKLMEIPLRNDEKKIKLVFSPQHGASYKLAPILLKKLGYKLDVVEEQMTPDGNFPNTPNPNPEDPRAFELMIKLGKKVEADLLVTTDPDADRVALGVLHKGEYILLNGHQMADLLVDYYISEMHAQGKLKKGDWVAKTVVTSSMTNDLLDKYGVDYKEVLTGFKFIGDIIIKSKKRCLLGFEESYGSLIRADMTLDKDSLQLMLILCEAANKLHIKKNKTLIDRLDELYEEYGHFIELNTSVLLTGPSAIENMDMTINEIKEMEIFGGLKVKKILDFEEGVEGFEKTKLVKLYTEDGSWFAIRPSGTEPRIRQYYCIKGKTKIAAEKKFKKFEKELNKLGGIKYEKQKN